MRKKSKTSRTSIDGFVPRQLGKGQESSARPRRRTLNSIPKAQKAENGIEFHEKSDAKAEDTLTIEPEELDLSGGRLEKPTKEKKRFGIFKRSSKNDKKTPLTKKQKIKRTVLVLLVIAVAIGGFLGWKFLRNAGKIFDGNVFGIFDNTKLRGEDVGRVNILLAGTSEDDPGHQGADLTDSIMVVSIDTKNNTAFSVSVPRDTWVDYGRACASGYQGKINVVYQCGKDVKFNEAGYPEGGMGLLSKIVSDNLGLKINYYGKINYTAFKQAVDAVGGIEVTIRSDDPRGVYDPNIQPQDGGPLKLTNGVQKINGKTALALARSRNSAGGYGMARGDFDRTNYQQQMLIALKDKTISAGTLTNPAKISGLLDAAGKNVKTDFKTNELRRLYEISKLVDSKKVTTIDLASEEINLLTTGNYQGQSIVQPVAGLSDFSQIQKFFKKLTSTDPVVREDATIVVLNGSGTVGLAQQRADELTKKGLDVIAVANATNRTGTVIVTDTKTTKDATKKLLESTFNTIATTSKTKYPDAANYDADFVVIIGAQKASNSSSN